MLKYLSLTKNYSRKKVSYCLKSSFSPPPSHPPPSAFFSFLSFYVSHPLPPFPSFFLSPLHLSPPPPPPFWLTLCLLCWGPLSLICSQSLGLSSEQPSTLCSGAASPWRLPQMQEGPWVCWRLRDTASSMGLPLRLMFVTVTSDAVGQRQPRCPRLPPLLLCCSSTSQGNGSCRFLSIHIPGSFMPYICSWKRCR